jgi:hypothetical protein
MPRDEQQHSWGRESRRDGSSEWPSTGFSTFGGEPTASRSMRSRRRLKKTALMSLALPMLVVLSFGAVGVMALANYLRA